MRSVSQVRRNRLFANSIGTCNTGVIDQENLARPFGRPPFGTEVDRSCRAMDVVAEMLDGSAILEVPRGGGIAATRLRPGQRVGIY